MKIEKICYSFIACLVAGSVIQNNMNLPWTYLIVISASLWLVCIGVQWYSEQREQEKITQKDSQKADKHNEEFEKIISILENCSSKQLELFTNEMTLLRTTYGDECKKVLESIQKLDESICILKNENIDSYNGIVASIVNMEEKNAANLQEMTKKLVDFLKGHSDQSIKQNDEAQEKYLASFLIIQKTLDLVKENVTELVNIEKNLLSGQNLFKGEIIDCIDNLMKKIISNDQELLGEIIQNVGKIDSKIETNNSLQAGLPIALNKAKEELIENSSKAIEGIVQRISELRSTADESKKVANDLKGMLSNIQTEAEKHNQVLASIEKLDDDSCGFIEDAKNKLQEIIGEIPNCVAQISDKQSEVINSEKILLERYDDVLKRINDEIVLKIVNDSNNLLLCMKDCYNLLESMRRSKKWM